MVKRDVKGTIKSFLAPALRLFKAVGRFFLRVWKWFWELLCRNKSFARFAYVTFPPKRRRAAAFLKRNRFKIIIPAAVCVVLAAALVIAGHKSTENSDYFAEGDESADFGMVLQHYSTFDHSEKTHIAVALSWKDGAVNLEGGRAVTKIKATVYPINLENPEIEWSSSDEEIATVDENGRIEATEPGRVEIYARLKNYNRYSKAKLAIRQSVTGIILPTSTMTLYTGGSARYLNARIFPANATNKNVTWKSKNPKIARVDSNGTVRAVGLGVTEITATTEDGGFEAKCFVTVVNPSVDVESLLLQNADDMNIRVGESVNAIMTVSPSNARNKTLKWSSDNEKIALVSQTGRVRGVSEGIAHITAESVNGKKQTFLVVVGENDEKNPFELGENNEEMPVENGTVTYTSYEETFPQTLRIQMSQNPPPKIWTPSGNINASEAETAEYLNPNSFYTDAYKYQFLDLSSQNNVSEEALNSYLSDKGVLRGKGGAFIEAAKRYNISEVYLVAHACLESGNGTSNLARGIEVNGTTVYNVYGINAFDTMEDAGGSNRAYLEGWTTVEDAIIGGAGWINEHYINSSEGRQNTLYKMRWNPENPGYHEYATDIGWAVKQAVYIEKIFEYFPDAQKTYEVPVYNGMIPPTLSTE